MLVLVQLCIDLLVCIVYLRIIVHCVDRLIGVYSVLRIIVHYVDLLVEDMMDLVYVLRVLAASILQYAHEYASSDVRRPRSASG